MIRRFSTAARNIAKYIWLAFCEHNRRSSKMWLDINNRRVVMVTICLDCGKAVPRHSGYDQQHNEAVYKLLNQLPPQ